MQIIQHQIQNNSIAEIISDTLIISNSEDGIDLVGTIYFEGYNMVILHQKNISADFFDLKTGIAGEILQKFSNYRIKLAIVGEYSGFKSNSLNDFIFESNKFGHINFLNSTEQAIEKLTK